MVFLWRGTCAFEAVGRGGGTQYNTKSMGHHAQKVTFQDHHWKHLYFCRSKPHLLQNGRWPFSHRRPAGLHSGHQWKQHYDLPGSGRAEDQWAGGHAGLPPFQGWPQLLSREGGIPLSAFLFQVSPSIMKGGFPLPFIAFCKGLLWPVKPFKTVTDLRVVQIQLNWLDSTRFLLH